MKLEDVKGSALQILAEERRYPTVQYLPADTSRAAPTAAEKFASVALLALNRSEEPRTILSDVLQFQFQSRNYDLLVKLLSRVDDVERQAFLDWIAERIKIFPASLKNKNAGYPSWNSQSSELPLIAEFLVRNGGKPAFFRILNSCGPTPGVAVMVLQLEDTVALNYPILSELEYSELAAAVSHLESASQALYMGLARSHGVAGGDWEHYGFNAAAVALHIVQRCHILLELCRKAQFLHLRSSLDEDVNLEINQDKYVVESFLEKFGFSKPLLTALNEAEKLNSPSATALELKSSMGHLRSFLEQIHAEAVPQIGSLKKIGPPADAKWGTLLAHLSINNFLSSQEAKFVAGLYVLISDEAVHPLIAKREYARLTRNVVIEYALLFLRKLEQLGTSNAPAGTNV
jgi:hypothetical protein